MHGTYSRSMRGWCRLSVVGQPYTLREHDKRIHSFLSNNLARPNRQYTNTSQYFIVYSAEHHMLEYRSTLLMMGESARNMSS
jgi:hypothetical protein